VEHFDELTRLVAERGVREHRNQHFAVAFDGHVYARPYLDYRLYPKGLRGDSGLELANLPSSVAQKVVSEIRKAHKGDENRSSTGALSTAVNNQQAAQALRTCVDRWNQGNMIGWGPGPANVAFRRPNAKERSRMELSSRRQCIVATAAGGGTWTCVLLKTGAYWCPPLHEPTGPPLRALGKNATIDRRGVLELAAPLNGTHPTTPLAWARYPRVDGYIHPWTSSGKLRRGLRFKGVGRGSCFLGAETARSAVSCLQHDTRSDACFPQRRPWKRGDLAACSFGPGSRMFTRWLITQGSDPPVLVPWSQVGSVSLDDPKIEVEADYGPEPSAGYRLHGGKVYVTFDRGRVDSIMFTTPYYRTKGGFAVGSRIPRGRSWHGFVWNAWVRAKPCSCWVKVGRGKKSLPATVKNFLKPWFFIYVHGGRVSSFYFASKFVD
jgi:hypothetical protein